MSGFVLGFYSWEMVWGFLSSWEKLYHTRWKTTLGSAPTFLRIHTSNKAITVMEKVVLSVEITPSGKHREFSCVFWGKIHRDCWDCKYQIHSDEMKNLSDPVCAEEGHWEYFRCGRCQQHPRWRGPATASCAAFQRSAKSFAHHSFPTYYGRE